MHSKPKQQKKTRRNRTPAPPPPRPTGCHPRAAQQVFRWMLRQGPMQQVLARAERDFYDRIFTPVVTLGAMIFPRRQPDHSHPAVAEMEAQPDAK